MKFDLRLYALLDPTVAGGHALTDLASRISGYATLVQLRDKTSQARALVEEARALREVLEPKGVPLLINDRTIRWFALGPRIACIPSERA